MRDKVTEVLYQLKSNILDVKEKLSNKWLRRRSFINNKKALLEDLIFGLKLSLAKRFKLLESEAAGYVLILSLVMIPVMLLGSKYVLDNLSITKIKQEKSTIVNAVEEDNEEDNEVKIFKRCAKQAALAVAENWNPGLTFGQQRDAVYKIADEVYNVNVCYNDSIIGSAIPGLDVKYSYEVEQDNSLGKSIKISHETSIPIRTIKYDTNTRYKIKRYYERCDGSNGSSWNPNYVLWRSIDKVSSPENRHSVYDEINKVELAKGKYKLKHHDIFKNPVLAKLPSLNDICNKAANGVYYPNDNHYTNDSNGINSRFVVEVLSDNNTNQYYSPNRPATATGNYSESSNTRDELREDEFDSDQYYEIDYKSRVKDTRLDPLLSNDPIRISIEQKDDNDWIKVETAANINTTSLPVDTVAYAKPAECNVDIVLAIPVNGAACNENNRDNASVQGESPLNNIGIETDASVPDRVKNTPIYQMGQACKNFVKKNFYHTKGVNMALIPYSGKLSISPEAFNKGWTVNAHGFDISSLYTPFMIGACLYGTKGTEDALLDQSSYRYADELTCYPIMCRAGEYAQTDPVNDYGNNYYRVGLILDQHNPIDQEKYKFLRMNLNPCNIKSANMLSMKCEKQCIHYLPNPYYMIEPTADLVKIYELCNGLYPIPDKYNVSNFVFAALEWANNMFQGWTTDPKQVSTITGSDDTAVFKRESKITEDRKKAVILLVNKPDWFEPGEMTYLGFSNDYSEVPMVESDCIRGDINYSDTTKYFADGSQYDGTIQGAKKILKLEKKSGYFKYSTGLQCYATEAESNTGGTATLSLSFPKKYLVKVVVEPMYIKTATLNSPQEIRALGYINDQYIVISGLPQGTLFTSSDGVNWVSGVNIYNASNSAFDYIIGYNAGKYIAISYTNIVKSGTSLSSMSNATSLPFSNLKGACMLNNKFMVVSLEGNLAYTTDGAKNWINMGSKLSGLNNKNTIRALAYGNGKMMANTYDGYVSRSYDSGYNWLTPDRGLLELREKNNDIWIINFGQDKFIALGSSGWISESPCGVVWSTPKREIIYTSNSVNSVNNIVFGKEGWVVVSTNKQVYRKQGSIKFTNISNITDGLVEKDVNYKLLKQEEFFIEPEQISNTQINGKYTIEMNLTNMRLISAEIMNRPYEKVTPEVSKSGNVFTLNAKVPFVVPIEVTGGNPCIKYNITSIDNREADIKFTDNCLFRVVPETFRYKKTFDNNGRPVYKVTLTPSNVTLGTPSIGTIRLTASVSGLTLDSDHVNSGQITSEYGDTFNYTTTKLSDLTGDATVSYNGSSGTITSPRGSVIHVKATPTGSVTFHGENNIDLAGINAVFVEDVAKKEANPNAVIRTVPSTTTSSSRTFTITGSTKFSFAGGQAPSGTYDNVNSTQGPNFGHNLSLYKVRYSCNNSRIIYANLKNQWLRDYIGTYSRKKNYKPLILRNGILAKRNSNLTLANPYSSYWTYGFTNTTDITYWYNDSNLTLFNKLTQNCLPNFRDPCCKVENVRGVMIGPEWGERYDHTTGGDWDIYFTFYGAQGNCQFWNAAHGNQIWLYLNYAAGGSLTIANGTTRSSDGWESFDATLKLNDKFKYNRKTSNDSNNRKVQIYLKNGMEKELILTNLTPYVTNDWYIDHPDSSKPNELYLADSSGVVQNATIKTYLEQNGDSKGKGGIYLVRLPSDLSTQIVAGDYVCFNGDGDLDVFVAPLPGSITFDCKNEDQTAHELYKEYNFCLEPSQMTDNEDGTQSVSFTTTGNVTVTATYEMKNRTQVTITKPSNIPMATINVTGHKKEIKWTTISNAVVGYPMEGEGFRFDGTRIIYINNYENNTNTINFSDDYGVTWKHINNNLPYAARAGDMPDAISFKCNSYDIFISYDMGKHYIQKNGVLPKMYKTGASFGGFKWSKNREAIVKYMMIRNDGDVLVSNDSVNWSRATTLKDIDNYWANGPVHVNNKWFATNTEIKYLYSSENGVTWNRTLLPINSMGIAYGSNLMMSMDSSCIITTSRDEFQTYNLRQQKGQGLNLDNVRSIGYANGNFILGRKGSQIAYTTFHDGVMWINNNSTMEQVGVSRDIDDNKVVVIDTEQNSSVVNSTNMTITGISIIYDRIVSETPKKVIEYSKIPLPNSKTSTVVDYSTNSKPVYDSNLVQVTKSSNTVFDNRIGYFVNGGGGNNFYDSHMYSKNDFYLLLEEDSSLSFSTLGELWHGAGISNNYACRSSRIIPGLSKILLGADEYWGSFGFEGNSKHAFIEEGVTRPINTVLYNRYPLENTDSYVTVNNDFNRKVMRDITTEACAKLKNAGVRIYVVKYKAQETWGAVTRSSSNVFAKTSKNHIYTEIENCATNSGGTVSSASTETGLKNALNAIANDIKNNYAGYTPARLMDSE